MSEERIQYRKTVRLPCCKHDGGKCTPGKCDFACALCRAAEESICSECNLFEDESLLRVGGLK